MAKLNIMDDEDDAKIFGRSLHLDIYGVSKERCDNLGFCYQFLEDLVEHLHMHKQSPPFIFRSPGDFPDKAGLSGWVPLIESGISIHTLTVRNFITLDVYTCGKLEVEKTTQFALDYFDGSSYERHYLERGLAYHRNSLPARAIIP